MKFKTSLLVLGAILIFSGAAANAQDEDLGALARAEREKREKEKKPAKVLTNEDVATSPSPTSSTGVSIPANGDITRKQRIKYIAVMELGIAEQEDIDQAIKVEGESPEDTAKRAKASAAAIEVGRKEIERLKNMPPQISDADLPPASTLSEKASRAFALMPATERARTQRALESGLQTAQGVINSKQCANPPNTQLKYQCQYLAHVSEMQSTILELLKNAPPPPPDEPDPTAMAGNEARAVASLRTLNTAEVAYASSYAHGYSQSLQQLGPAGDQKPSDAHAGLIDATLATGTKSGYVFSYTPHANASTGQINSYTLTADPVQSGKDGAAHYFTDQTYFIHKTTENRQATAQDPKL